MIIFVSIVPKVEVLPLVTPLIFTIFESFINASVFTAFNLITDMSACVSNINVLFPKKSLQLNTKKSEQLTLIENIF